MSIRVATFVLMMAGSALAAGARAQGTAVPAETDQKYRELIQEALSEFAASRWHEARSLFELAHSLRASARTLRGLGLTSFEQGQYVRAVGELQAALAHQDNPLTDKQRSEIEGALAKAKRFIGIVRVETTPKDVELLVDGVATSGREVTLDIGEHALQVRADGYDPARQTVQVEGGRSYTVRFDLSPSRKDDSLAEPKRPAQRAQPRAIETTPLQWIALGSATAVAAGGGVLLGLAADAKNEVESAPDGSDLADLEGAHDRAPALAITGSILLAAGLAGAGATLVWMLTSTSEESAPLSVSFDGTALHVRGAL